MYALYEYVPMRRIKSASFRQLDINRRILDFKDGRNYASRWAAHMMAYCLQCLDLRDVVIVCLPASSQLSYVRRFKRFTKELCKLTHAVDGFSMVTIHSCREKRHLSKERSHISCMSNASIDESIRGRKVLVVDDICTSCSSAKEFISFLSAVGAEVVMAVFLAKTKQFY